MRFIDYPNAQSEGFNVLGGQGATGSNRAYLRIKVAISADLTVPKNN